MAPRHPHIREAENDKRCKQLVVNGEPFLVLGASVHNSSMSSADFLKPGWKLIREDNINTISGAVTWEQIEPVEGEFNFSELDQVLQDARSNGLHLILHWFGSFKHGRCSCVPGWVKRDVHRFPRVKIRQAGDRTETANALTIFGPQREALKAEKKAFEALMHHIKGVDEEHSTVIMVQVESEVGIRGDSRDGSASASAAFNASVPRSFVDKLLEDVESLHQTLRINLGGLIEIADSKELGSWPEVFGDSQQTDEIFMAYHLALYLEELAAAGHGIYPLPYYTDVTPKLVAGSNAVPQTQNAESKGKQLEFSAAGGDVPGVYPSGIPVINVLDIWQLFAPSLDLIAPQQWSIAANSANTYIDYRHRTQPLFIPALRRDDVGAGNAWLALAADAIGVSYFGIDSVRVEHGRNPFKKHYELLSKVSKIVLAAQTKPDQILGVHFPGGKIPLQVNLVMGEWSLCVEPAHVTGEPGTANGLVIQLEEGNGSRFLLLGWGFQVSFKSTRPKAHFTGILSFEEKDVVNATTGELKTIRLLNGDESRSGNYAVMPNENPDYGENPMSVLIPANTAIAEVEVYALEEN